MAVVSEIGAEERESSAWLRAHAALLKLAKRRAGLDFDEGLWLLAALRCRAHAQLGYGSHAEYAERLFGYSPRLTSEKLRVAEALEDLPDLAGELREGKLSFSAVRELTRVATRSTERAWLEAARDKTVREVEQLVSGHRPGSRPDDLADSAAKRHVLRFEVSGETLAVFRDALARVRRDAGGPIDEDAALLLLAREALGGPREEGRASYQVALTVCERCLRGQQLGKGELFDVAPEVVAMAACDCQFVGDARSGAHVGPSTSAQAASDANRGGVTRAGTDQRRARAKQDIPPSVRTRVRRRDNGRCVVWGCRHAVFVDVHHLNPRSEGGTHDPENLVTLCTAHHRACHDGAIVIAGTPSIGLRFEHADGTPYGTLRSPELPDVRAQVCRALKRMGFGQNAAKQAVLRVPANAGASIDLVLRTALQFATEAHFIGSATKV
jgi:hypothetical protein